MSDLDFSPESEQGAFNAGIEYLKTLVALEREIDFKFLCDDFDQLDRLLDVLWMELDEWLVKEEEIAEQNRFRIEQKAAAVRINHSKRYNSNKISFVDVEAFKNRYRALKKLMHKKGLRMPKKDDPAFAISAKHY